MKFQSIAKRIFVMVIPTIIITIISFGALSYYISDYQINKTVNEKMRESLHAAALEIQLELYKSASIAVNFANYGKTLDSDTFDHDKNRIFLSESIMSNTNTSGGGVCFKPYGFDSGSYYFNPFLYVEYSGGDVYIPNYGDNVDYFNEDWYLKAENSGGKMVWSDVYFDPVSDRTMITAAMPFLDENGGIMGAGTSDMDLESIRHIVNGISVGETGKAFILGAGGEYISFYGEGKSPVGLMQQDSEEALAKLGNELTSNDSGITSLDRNGKKFRVYYMTMSDVDWTLAVTVEEREIKSSAMSSFIGMMIIPLLGLALVILGIFMVAAYLRRIVKKVNHFADMAASGDFSKRIEVTEIDEFGFMEQRLNKMISNMDEMSRHSAELLKMAKAASEAKSDFLSRMSHEIRTPMNAIIGMTQIAISTGDEARVRDCLSKINNASKHLLSLINDILDISKIEANKLELSTDEFGLQKTLSDVCNMMRVKAEEKHQRLTLNIDENVPEYIIGDELRLSQVITNLVGNAVKFTPENGVISINVTEIEQDGGDSVIKVGVKDSGIGLTPEQSSRLFRSFEQADGSIARKFGGSGLGLVISKSIVEMMNGRIWVESEPDEGSTFAFTFKAPRGSGFAGVKKRHMEQTDADGSTVLRILVVDDSEEANEYMKYILNVCALDCDIARDGREAIAAVEKAMAEDRMYDVIFMDYTMPGLNGIETARMINKISNEGSAVIMVSIYDWKDIEHIEREAKDAGIKKHITKPFSLSCVVDSINEVTSEIIKSNASKARLSTSDFSGSTVLLVEDIEINREIVFAFLDHTNINIEVAENGAIAVEKFRANPDKYDLVLMDVQMPEMDGFEATRQIRATDIKRAKTIPIIAMTANALSEDVKKCKASGMNDHLSKPLNPELLLVKLNDYFFMKDFLNRDIV